MQVSVTLHREAPDLNGTQSFAEPQYTGYNRKSAELVIAPDGNGVCEVEGLNFPALIGEPETYKFFSLGDPSNGAIIIFGPLNPPLVVQQDENPMLSILVGVTCERLALVARSLHKGNGVAL